eukprot:scaffold33728_cov101-Isochrysis_galbana.AAC.2
MPVRRSSVSGGISGASPAADVPPAASPPPAAGSRLGDATGERPPAAPPRPVTPSPAVFDPSTRRRKGTPRTTTLDSRSVSSAPPRPPSPWYSQQSRSSPSYCSRAKADGATRPTSQGAAA